MNVPTTTELQKMIHYGEDGSLELKEVRFQGKRILGPSQSDLADEISAFANSDGGMIILGVNDKTRDILGIPLEKIDDVEALIIQASQDSLDPPYRPKINRIGLPNNQGKELPLILVQIPRSPTVHNNAGRYFYRVGSSKRVMSKEYLTRILQQRSGAGIVRYDETSVAQATLQHLSKDLWERFLGTLNKTDTTENMLRKLGILSQTSEVPTVAGLLMTSLDPQEFLPHAFIQAVAYRGKTVVPLGGRSYQNDAQDITGPLEKQIAHAFDFVRKNMLMNATKGELGGRIDLPQYDMVAIFEALTNAVAHRDYSMWGSHIRLRMFDDRLELYIPGQLTNSLTPELLPFRQDSRNPTLTSLLARSPVSQREVRDYRHFIMDKRGEGVPAILNRSEELSKKTPKYSMPDKSELILTIYAAHPETQED